MSDTISGAWIVAALIVPTSLAVGVAWPFWGRARDSAGSLLGLFVIFVSAVAFIGRELIHVQRLTERCAALETICRFQPEPYVRFFLYGFIAMIEAFVLFAIGAAVEKRVEEREFASEWRRR